jgi:hypothetical protein
VDRVGEYREMVMMQAYPGTCAWIEDICVKMKRERVRTQADWEDRNLKEATIPSSPEHLIEVQKGTNRTNTHEKKEKVK